jgi:two-component system OmpR family sensor kinase
LFAFGALYLALSLGIIILFSTGYYIFSKERMLQQKRLELNPLANIQVQALQDLHVSFDKTQTYPRSDKFTSGIYDADRVEIFSLLHVKPKLDRIIYLKDGFIHYIKEPQMHYLGTRYLVLEIPDSGDWLAQTWQNIALWGALALVVFGVGGYFLMRLFLRPMREAVSLLDRFIKDTTHELNTPINAILSNIEMLESKPLDAGIAKKFTRIRIGAQTVANLYQDLTYLTLGHRIASKDTNVELLSLCQERVEYVSLMCESKKLQVSVTGEPSYLYIDLNKITKVIDNLLSNAIKYNKIGGKISLHVSQGSLSIKDTGRGIDADKIQSAFERYTRHDVSVGGFGIGLSIVGVIVKEYGLDINITSSKEGTCVQLSWPQS